MKTTVKAGNRLKIWEIALLLGVALCLLSGAKALHTQDELADKVVRLHVLANSDSEEDQALKLRVRDAVLDRAEDLLIGVSNRAEAEGMLRGQLLEFERLAEAVVRKAGYDYEVTAELTDTEFPTREYEGFTLPAGEYLALRILIGEAAGRNWWCVAFPPLCLGAASETVEEAARAGSFTQNQAQLITRETEGYVLKFKGMELLGELQGLLS